MIFILTLVDDVDGVDVVDGALAEDPEFIFISYKLGLSVSIVWTYYPWVNATNWFEPSLNDLFGLF